MKQDVPRIAKKTEREAGYCRPSLFFPLLLLVVGSAYLLRNLGILPFGLHLWRYWPVILIVIGTWMLWTRAAGSSPPGRY